MDGVGHDHAGRDIWVGLGILFGGTRRGKHGDSLLSGKGMEAERLNDLIFPRYLPN